MKKINKKRTKSEMSCVVCKLKLKPSIKCECGVFVCKKCDYSHAMQWVCAWDELKDMMSEDEALKNYDLVDEALKDGEFKCITCLN